jgi:hypothetical protein
VEEFVGPEEAVRTVREALERYEAEIGEAGARRGSP